MLEFCYPALGGENLDQFIVRLMIHNLHTEKRNTLSKVLVLFMKH